MASSSSPLEHLARFAQLDRVERRVALAAVALLPPVTIALHARGMASARNLAARLARALPALERAVPARRVAALVAGVAHALPDRRVAHITCLARGLVVCALLERRGEHATLQLGVRRDAAPRETLDAHAWVELDGEVVSDAERVEARYAKLATV